MNIAAMTVRELARAVREGLLDLDDVREEGDKRKALGLTVDEPRELATDKDSESS